MLRHQFPSIAVLMHHKTSCIHLLIKWPNIVNAGKLHCHCEQVSTLSYVYSICVPIVNGSKFICGIYFGTLPLMIHIELFGHMWYSWHLHGIFVAGTYITILWYIKTAVCCFWLMPAVRWVICVHYSNGALGYTYAVWQLYLFRGIWQYVNYSVQSIYIRWL